MNLNRARATADAALFARAAYVQSFVVTETSGSAVALVKFYDAASATGTPIMTVGVLSGETKQVLMHGYPVGIGVYADLVSGAADIYALYE